MALTSKLPPQAYTRDTLVKAIEWLSGQPPAVRERANSADLIVSHYLQSRRQAAAVQMEAPLSQENFKADLKHLAEDLKQFEEPSAPPLAPKRSPSYVNDQLENIVSQHRQDNLFRHSLQQEMRAEAPPSVRPTEVTVKGVAWTVDPRSLAIARDLQEALNLSSEGEALRMLVSLGAERARGLIS